jgi:phage shock protein A|tara:strand:+ start:1321 stop:2019 length:699 start_codon:yes stop_codon:yes gene_type:complete
MSVLKRLFKMGEAELHSALEKLEDPIKLTEQGIRDLKKDLDQSIQALAEVKALNIRAKNDIEKFSSSAKEYESKAMILLRKAQEGKMDPGEADRLATEALRMKDENIGLEELSKNQKLKFEQSIVQLEANVKTVKSNISKWENELKTLKARVKVSNASKKINKQLAQIDSSGTVSMLEKMKDKVQKEEALAESYGEIANESKSVDAEIDKALESNKDNSALEDLKKKMGFNQ